MSTLTITETEMTSDTSRHTASVVSGVTVEGGPTAWAVTWLPGRVFTRNQAITAMTLAEVIAVTDLTDNASPVWLHVDGWAAELGITGPHAVAEASMAPEDIQDAPKLESVSPAYLLACGDGFADGDVHAPGDAVCCAEHGGTTIVMTIPLGAATS